MPKALTKAASRAPKKIVKRMARNRSPVIAAVDLGSNSFHLVIAKVENGEPVVVDKLREMLRFGSGLDHKQHIRPVAAKAALACLRRFGQRLALWRPELVRAVGTNTLRQAVGTESFLHKAQARLGVPVEVVSGIEEARLIYRGVSPGIAAAARALVVDIGGGSTELIVGVGGHAEVLESVTMGCVTLTDRLLAGHLLTEARFAQAVTFARHQLMPLRERLRAAHWERAVGSSGTIRAVDAVARELGFAAGGLTVSALAALQERVVVQRHVDRLVLPGLATERAPVFAGGLAIVIALFEVLEITTMEVAKGALREGILRDLIGRLSGEDVRNDAIARFATRWPDPCGTGVTERIDTLFEMVAGPWRLSLEDRRLLGWAVQLHACGTAINRLRYERHSAYIVTHAELAGFAPREQALLGMLIAMHRGKWTQPTVASMKRSFGETAVRLAILTRIIVTLLRVERLLAISSRRAPWHLAARANTLEISTPLRAHPMREAFWRELGPEIADMQKGGVRFLLNG
ncbi:Ppx/GppA phosphatase family protein [Acidiferrobacter sp.]|jgi:exopolyphosphatase/guanosine-5'-triphosphate,3'-diphosphate pyrophosphatase|uniref:Ppx/GppA phosphatase family protein n=1 Tax=Acidiferrobacter sp. TaxID=1872107 RepID=UPI00262998E0|nr:Ppx/GppA phosphatase family protein [Acidiferrobacter sp.]